MKYFKFVLSVYMISWLIVCYASSSVRARAVNLKIVNEKLIPPGNRKGGDKILKIDLKSNDKKINIPQDPEDLAIVFGVGKLKDFNEKFKNAVRKQEAILKGNDLKKKVTQSNISTDNDAPWYNFDKLMAQWDFIEPVYEIVKSFVKNKKLHKGIGTMRNGVTNFGTLLKGFIIDMLDPLPQYLEEEMNYEKWNFKGLYKALSLYYMIKSAMIIHYINKMQQIVDVIFENAVITHKYLYRIFSGIQQFILLKGS